MLSIVRRISTKSKHNARCVLFSFLLSFPKSKIICRRFWKPNSIAPNNLLQITFDYHEEYQNLLNKWENDSVKIEKKKNHFYTHQTAEKSNKITNIRMVCSMFSSYTKIVVVKWKMENRKDVGAVFLVYTATWILLSSKLFKWNLN